MVCSKLPRSGPKGLGRRYATGLPLGHRAGLKRPAYPHIAATRLDPYYVVPSRRAGAVSPIVLPLSAIFSLKSPCSIPHCLLVFMPPKIILFCGLTRWVAVGMMSAVSPAHDAHVPRVDTGPWPHSHGAATITEPRFGISYWPE